MFCSSLESGTRRIQYQIAWHMLRIRNWYQFVGTGSWSSIMVIIPESLLLLMNDQHITSVHASRGVVHVLYRCVLYMIDISYCIMLLQMWTWWKFLFPIHLSVPFNNALQKAAEVSLIGKQAAWKYFLHGKTPVRQKPSRHYCSSEVGQGTLEHWFAGATIWS